MDCFGPFHVKTDCRTEKRWGILFKCQTTRCLYLDLLTSLDVDNFLMALLLYPGEVSHMRFFVIKEAISMELQEN